jgi:hypothetical protein
MLVFRDGRRQLAVPPLLDQLSASCRQGSVLEALLRAGELECLLADVGSSAESIVAEITDRAADALCGGDFDRSAACALPRIAELPASGSASVPEGFAYYALHPREYADAMALLPPAPAALVVGIRSIGTSLSAVARAALARRGVRAERMTVRPIGHPWARETHFTETEKQRLRLARAAGAPFVVVDEGPGLSGSSFLSVAEALVAAGVPPECITLVGSHAVEPARLCARDAAARWTCFRYFAVEGGAVPSGALDLSGGEWRRVVLPRERSRPGSWTQFERRKFLTADRATLLKFEGLGHYGRPSFARAHALAEEGLSPRVAPADDGFAAYEFIPGGPLHADDVNAAMLSRLAEYCAARVRLTPAPAPAAENAALRHMVEVNWREAFGSEITVPELPVVAPVIADGRMQPHEWVGARDGRILKTDAASHGDDHFFPGPTDIAWDLAGAMVEWDLDRAASDLLLAEYRRFSGDDAGARVRDYILGYALFRLGYCNMAADAVRGSDEAARLWRDEQRYRALLSPARAGSHSKLAA